MKYTKSRTLNEVINNTLIICAIILVYASVAYAFYKYEEYTYSDTHNFETGCPHGTDKCEQHDHLKCHGHGMFMCLIFSTLVCGAIASCIAIVGFVLFICYQVGICAKQTFRRIVLEYDEYDAHITEEQKSRIQ